MFSKSTREQTTNKLLILYALECLDFPVPNYVLTDIFMNTNMMHYYLFQQYLAELIELDLANTQESPQGKKLISITSKGSEALEFFGNDAPSTLKDSLKKYIKDNSSSFVRYNQIKAISTKIDDDHYNVQLSIFDKNYDLINITIDAPSNTIAQDICSKWESEHYEIFNSILKILTAKPKA
ncbi:MAG: DUF4364 family protein [Filifactoraceae bacterium]